MTWTVYNFHPSVEGKRRGGRWTPAAANPSFFFNNKRKQLISLCMNSVCWALQAKTKHTYTARVQWLPVSEGASSPAQNTLLNIHCHLTIDSGSTLAAHASCFALTSSVCPSSLHRNRKSLQCSQNIATSARLSVHCVLILLLKLFLGLGTTLNKLSPCVYPCVIASASCVTHSYPRWASAF